jgi:hypothetical protein
VEGVGNAAPTGPDDGTCWLIGAAPTGAWSGQAGKLACRQLGNWLFITPLDGVALLNNANGQVMRFVGGSWAAPIAPTAPVAGTTIDTELRAAFAALTSALVTAGIFATP